MNPFIKSSEMSGMQLADKLMARIEKARTDQPDPNEAAAEYEAQAAEAQAEQVEAEMKQQQEQEKLDKQQVQDDKRQRTDMDRKTTALVNASKTPSYKPYVIKQAAGLGSFFQMLRGAPGRFAAGHPTITSGAKALGEGGLTLGSGAGNAYLWDQMIYDTPMFGEDGVTEDKVRGFGATIAGLTGMLIPRSVYAGVKHKGLFGGAASGLVAGGAIPAAERGASIGLFDMLPTAAEAQDLKLKMLKEELKNKGQVIATATEEGSGAWPWLAGAGLGLAAIPALAYTYKALRGAGKEPEDVRNPDRVALEIPAHKISDSLYNSLGREILFKDKKEDDRAFKQASIKSAEKMELSFDEAKNTLTPKAFNHWIKDYHKPTGVWNFVETFAPLASALLGGPQLGSFQQRLTRDILPFEPGKVMPRVQNQWAQTLASLQQPPYKWTAGEEFTVTPEYQLS